MKINKCKNTETNKNCKESESGVSKKSNVGDNLSTAKPVTMQQANDHSKEATKLRIKDENISVIDEEKHTVDVSSTVNPTLSNSPKEKMGENRKISGTGDSTKI